ncbi:MAG: sigma-54-dependent Fis family transcriptional regulator [Elusimicrobia bacterium]|nr:sigma-54-dependent Fis family transcriptional regulator [Elusimicrobiota bacterium]MDE2426008.1 sigma-54-dependent Fis family transcriptional regulator [Elusimicrobiota bacterium]
MALKILLVEDDPSQQTLLSFELKGRGYAVTAAKSASEALAHLARDNYELVLTDLRLADSDGLEVLRASKREQPDAEVVVVTGHGSISSAVAAMKAGAFDFLTKPIETEQLALVLHKALERRSLLGEVRRLREEVKGKYSFEGIVYGSPQMHRVLELVKKVAVTEATVLVCGESGTGKELVARAIHENSPRRSGSFVAINCGALPEGLLESELFGHVKGSFTGADRNKRGLFEEASGGTLFLDEISETSLALQVKLLRALQEGEVRRVGDNHPIKVSGRLVAATNKDLAQRVKEGKFREDLYYRLKVFPIEIPPLRQRREDILPLAEHFLRKAKKKTGGSAVRLAPEAASALAAYSWPGNVRELEHAIERALIMASGPAVSLPDLPAELQGPSGVAAETLEELERKHILAVFEACGGNATEAARRLGVGRNTLWRKLKSYGVAVTQKAR